MGMRACAVALWCALAVASAAAYTVDCNHEYTDCDTELSKLGIEDDEIPFSFSSSSSSTSTSTSIKTASTSAPFLPTLPTIPPEHTTEKKELQAEEIKHSHHPAEDSETEPSENEQISETTEAIIPKQGRLLNINVDELQNFANALHNDTNKRIQVPKVDLSDVNMDEEEEETRLVPDDHRKQNKPMLTDKFYSNLQVPFSGILGLGDTKASEEQDTCKENEVTYKIGDRIDRGCEETCECLPGGTFECSPRCKHPYIRRGRRLTDPLCFESPVDECCSIIACSTGNQEVKVSKVDVCRYNNETHAVGEKWHTGCDQTCSCEANSVVTCKPRCTKLIQSDKCINVQDPNDECCEVQVCDVSQDAHEEPENATSSTTTTTTTPTTTTVSKDDGIKGLEYYSDLKDEFARPLNFLPTIPSSTYPGSEETTSVRDPIGSVRVLQNNSVQVNLMHMNIESVGEKPIHLMLSSDGGKSYEDVELKYSNLILNLPGGKNYILKSKESGTKFNFTITATEDKANDTISIKQEIGCMADGIFYAVGEEFHIGCSQLCECTGHNSRECVDLVCPSHVGLELVSKGCVRWAPSPPAKPPNCCPRAARCLSDGTCHYNGTPIPNWSEVPISLTGCEQRCFCENGELDCQEVCTPLPPVPPQSLRCPPLHHPAPLNISDEDCCKRWGCMPNVEDVTTEMRSHKYEMPMFPFKGSFTTLGPTKLAQPCTTTNFYKHLHPVKSVPKMIKTVLLAPITNKPLNYHVDISETSNDLENRDHSKTTLDWTGRSDISHKVSQFNFPLKGATKYNVEVQDESNTSEDNSMDDFGVLTHQPLPEYNYHISQPLPKITKKIKLKPQTTYFSPTTVNKVVQKVKIPVDDYRVIGLSRHNLFVPNFNVHSLKKKLNLHSYKMNEAYKHMSYIGDLKSHKYLNSKPVNQKTPNVENYEWRQDTHVLNKAPNPYESVLLRPVKFKVNKDNKNTRIPSPLAFEQIVNQLEVESEINRNLGRSANVNKAKTTTAGNSLPPIPGVTHPLAPFLPTVPPVIPPGIHFPRDPDYPEVDSHKPSRDPGIPSGPLLPGDENKKLTVLSLQADSPTSVKLLFGLPPVLVGLRGSVDLRYTDKLDQEVSQWYSQVFAPADEVLTTPRLEFRLTGLKPSTTYKIKGKLFLHNLPVEPESQVYSIRTMDLPSVMPDEEKRREIDTRLTVVDVNDTAAHVSWRHFTEDELQYVDGIQVRYRPVGTPIYSMTELLHHSRSIAELRDLRPGTRYEASLVIVPPPRASTELYDPGQLEFTTDVFVDPYNWTVTVDVRMVGSDGAELTWRGVPSPAERWVRVYRAAHACGDSRHEHDDFRLATRELPPTIKLIGLKPGTRCRVWLELFLTNGKIKTSNVLEINTKSENSPEDIDNEVEASLTAGAGGARGDGRGDYYGALVVVGVVAALGALTSLLLLLVLVRRHRPRSVPITPVPTAPRESSLPPYDNPAYKLELQQETMDL